MPSSTYWASLTRNILLPNGGNICFDITWNGLTSQQSQQYIIYFDIMEITPSVIIHRFSETKILSTAEMKNSRILFGDLPSGNYLLKVSSRVVPGIKRILECQDQETSNIQNLSFVNNNL
jgi:hypothetical protein